MKLCWLVAKAQVLQLHRQRLAPTRQSVNLTDQGVAHRSIQCKHECSIMFTSSTQQPLVKQPTPKRRRELQLTTFIGHSEDQRQSSCV